MGCCVSTNTKSRRSKTSDISRSKSAGSPRRRRRQPILEEEAVKEVLSETAIVHEDRSTQSVFVEPEAPLPEFSDKASQDGVVGRKPPTAFSNDDLSEIRGNLSESASASTAVTENRENNGSDARELRQRSPARSKNRDYSGEVKREKTVGTSPGRRSETSPNRYGSGYGRKRDSGDISGRRSTSPAAQTALGRTPSGRRKTGRSPGRAGPERILKGEEGRENGWPPTRNESLENPLVSLECFIFL